MTKKNLPILKLIKENMEPEEQYLAWRTCLAPFFDIEPIKTPEFDQFESESTWHLLDDLVMAESIASHSSYQRDKKWLNQHDDAEHILFQLYLQGTNQGVNGDRVFHSEVGDIVAIDTRKEIYAQTNECKILSVVVPRHLIKEADKLNGANLTSGNVRTRLLREHMLTLWKSMPEIMPEENSVLSHGLIDLINALFKPDNQCQENEASALEQSLLSSMKNHIEQNLHIETLGVDMLCKNFHCSRSSLYRLFQADGGVASYIRKRRLIATFKVLIMPRNNKVRIIDVAAQYGFINQATFSRLFLQHFGISPSDVASLKTNNGFSSEQFSHQVTAHRISQWIKSL